MLGANTGSTTRLGSPKSRTAAATAPVSSAVASMPVLTASTPMSVTTLSIWPAPGPAAPGGRLDAECVLGGDGDEGGGAPHAVGLERLEVGDDAGAAARVGAGDGEGDGCLHCELMLEAAGRRALRGVVGARADADAHGQVDSREHQLVVLAAVQRLVFGGARGHGQRVVGCGADARGVGDVAEVGHQPVGHVDHGGGTGPAGG